MILPIIIVSITSLIFVSSINWVFHLSGLTSRTAILGSSISSLMKLITLLSLIITLSYSILLWNEYPFVSDLTGVPLYPANSWFELHHTLNLPFIILSIFILIAALLTSWYSAVNTHLFLSLVLLIEICLVGTFSTTNIFLFLLAFEASAIPIFILMVYAGSDRRERLKASYYFIFFTLYGSLSLLLVIISVYSNQQTDFIADLDVLSTSYALWVLLFIAFAVKIPLFPFHLWLPYAHVEASTATSILLAALMLKLGGYGILKFLLPLFDLEIHSFYRPVALIVCAFGVIYGGIAALRQIDLKRQIAFSSISHMSFATLGIFTFSELGAKGSMYLMLSHGLTSAALFYLVGVLSERYHTRSVMAYGGLLGIMPVFSFFLIVSSLANVGFPGTSGFLPELFVLISVLSMSSTLLLPTLFGMFLTTASTLVLLLRLLFGHLKTLYSSSAYSDVSKLETIVLSSLSFWMIALGLVDILNQGDWILV